MTLLGVALAGACGATARFGLERSLTRRFGHAFPWGTLAVNVTGSLALGFLTGLGIYRGLGSTSRIIVGTGFLGGYTTFSTYAVETLRLWEDYTHRRAAAYALASMAVGVSAAGLGLVLAGLA